MHQVLGNKEDGGDAVRPPCSSKSSTGRPWHGAGGQQPHRASQAWLGVAGCQGFAAGPCWALGNSLGKQQWEMW